MATRLPFLQHLSATDRQRLCELAARFLRSKTFEGAQGLVVTDRMRMTVALQACLLVLHLDVALYDNWHAIILYPGDFRVDREEVDEAGVVHQWSEELAGESWEQGPVILSWEAASAGDEGMNVVLHEFAHKLDMRDGAANGCPPLRADMSPERWTQRFSAAYARFEQALEQDGILWLDDYAAHSPGEFFAVLSEMFFLRPADVRNDMPEVYEELRSFYGQDPVVRYGSSA
jgi:hypothetical protein